MSKQLTDETRRRVLTAGGSAALMGLAGCLGGDSGDESDGGMEEESDGGMEGESDGGMENESDGGMEEESDGGMEGEGMEAEPTDPDEAPRTTIDRFSEAAGTLHVRGSDNDLPAAGDPVDFDERFLVDGFGPDGQRVRYYDFDVQPTAPAPIYAFVRENGDPVEGQRNVVGVVPGDDGYNDFWHVHRVTVSDEYVANTVTGVEGVLGGDFEVEATDTIKNCPVVPDGSTAERRHGADESAADLVEGWYDGEIVYYFLFEERALEPSDGEVPLSPIYVSFNTNPGQEGGGPQSGFATEAGNDQTHNVTSTVPSDAAYSPLWDVNIYDNADFDSVSDLDSALDAAILASGAARVNCPVVSEN
ncbi:hypothetical protein CK500_02440 [Halorubrum salipaludis]|uniref:Uncharacterized protein n=1 Tax=Halorubrum salipaludis TaxID=2032630 RepID=A0A2A2FJA4_9EURY|nr:hypothetical protein [Halorubrum salipaludis]PAU85546.1 hypothetical protein CK500_02440 [Halorubrum salipaludis]